MNYMKKLMLELWLFFKVPLILIIFIILGIFLLSISNHFSFFDGRTHDPIDEINSLAIIILTIALVAIAWIQSTAILKTSRGDYLLRIDDRFGSPEIIKARTIIHEIYLETMKNEDYKNNHPNTYWDTNKEDVATRIKNMAKDKMNTKNFIYLLNFLDFLETIAYFSNKENVSSNEVKELIGQSFDFYCDLFKPYMETRRRHDKSYYSSIYKYRRWTDSEKTNISNQA